MDNHYVPNLTFGALSGVKRYATTRYYSAYRCSPIKFSLWIALCLSLLKPAHQ
ncbi:hypothetical protein O9929_06250 [Vibrio lentus]|nr:hypothetical protein [Vibrio lentus]